MNGRALPLLALAVALAIFFLYVNPTWSGPIAETKAAIAAADETLAAAARYEAQQNQLAAARNAIDPADLKRLELLLPDSVDNVGMILDLNALAARTGLSLANIDVTAAVSQQESDEMQNTEGPVGSVDMSLSATGTYAALQSFLQGIERSRRLLDVQKLAVKGSDTGVYAYDIQLRLYWLR